MLHVRPASLLILSATLVAMTGCGTKDTTVCCAIASPPGSPGSQPTSTPASNPTATPVGTPTSTPVGTPTSTPVGTPTSTPVGTPTSTPVSAPTSTPVVTPTATPAGTPTATPIPTPLPSVQYLTFSPGTLNITGAGNTESFTVTDSRTYAGFFTATTENSAIATVESSTSYSTFVVTAVAAGATYVDVSSTDGGFNRIAVTVTNSGVIVNRKVKS